MGDQDGAGRNYERAAAKLLDAIDGALPLQSRVDALQDLAEVQYATGKAVEAEEMLKRVEEEIGGAYQITPDGHHPSAGVSSQYFVTLGKVSLMRGRMALDRKDIGEGARQYYLPPPTTSVSHPSSQKMAGREWHALSCLDSGRQNTFCQVLVQMVKDQICSTVQFWSTQ
jgi:hypothetical protein